MAYKGVGGQTSHRLLRLLGLGCTDASQDAQITKPRMPSMPPSPVTRLVYVPAAATPSAHACSRTTQCWGYSNSLLLRSRALAVRAKCQKQVPQLGPC